MKVFLVLAGVIALVAAGRGQPPGLDWSRTYTDEAMMCKSVDIASDGAPVFAAICPYWGWEGAARLIKLGLRGDTLWSRYYDGYCFGIGSVHKTEDYGFIIIGTVGEQYQPFSNIWLIKTDSIGHSQWGRGLGWSDCDEQGYDVCRAPQGGFAFVAHRNQDASCGPFPGAITDASGGIVRSLDAQDPVGYFYTRIVWLRESGYAAIGINGDNTIVVKCTYVGGFVWQRYYGLSGEQFTSLTQATDSGFIMIGTTPINGQDILLARTDRDGVTRWSRHYGGAGADIGVRAYELPNRDIIVAGRTASFGHGQYDYFLMRVSSQGDSLWSATYGTSASESLTDMAVKPDGSYILVGNTDAGFDVPYVVETLPDHTEDVDYSSVQAPHAFSLSSFPNPFNPTTTLSLTLPKAGRTKIVVYDITGREVKTLSNEMFTAGEHTLRFDGSTLPSGIYFARMQSGEFVATQKLLLLK